uniref:Uncharacterized protein n=1 Tax=Aegilops tauschii subsp. strangulata TaxID=200361 RepID=A0A453J6C7_AEGTS
PDRSHPKSLVPYLTAAAAPKSDRRQRPPPPQPRRRRRPPPPQLRHRPEPPSPPPPHPATPAPLAALNPSTAGGGPHHHSPAASSSHPTAADRRPPRRSQSLAPTTAQQRRSTPTDRGVEHRAGPLPLRPLRSSKQRASLFSGEQLTATSTSSPFPQAAERPSSSASSSATSTSTSSLWTGLPPEHPLSEHLEHADKDICPTCKTSRWKSEKNNLDGKRVHKVPRKVLRYFPIKKRLQRLFVSPKSATDCKWHDEERTRDGLIRHTADAPAWKDFDAKYPKFAEDSRNIRLLICADGFNPFRTMNLSCTVWPVVAISLNLPPWLCMKQQNFILSLLIPGPKSPGRDIDVFLEPLIDDLNSLFEEGVR